MIAPAKLVRNQPQKMLSDIASTVSRNFVGIVVKFTEKSELPRRMLLFR